MKRKHILTNLSNSYTQIYKQNTKQNKKNTIHFILTTP